MPAIIELMGFMFAAWLIVLLMVGFLTYIGIVKKSEKKDQRKWWNKQRGG